MRLRMASMANTDMGPSRACALHAYWDCCNYARCGKTCLGGGSDLGSLRGKGGEPCHTHSLLLFWIMNIVWQMPPLAPGKSLGFPYYDRQENRQECETLSKIRCIHLSFFCHGISSQQKEKKLSHQGKGASLGGGGDDMLGGGWW